MKTISLPQAKRLFAIAKEAGKSAETVKAYVKSLGINASLEIPVERYESIVSWAGTKTETIDTTTGAIETETPGVGE